jgi:PDZ domain
MTIITATVDKPTADSKLGIAFSRADKESPLVIKMIREDSLFASSDLKAGMLVESVMGVPMMFATPKEAADALISAEAGEVVVKALAMIGEISKADDTKVKLGISLKNSTTKPGIFVSNIGEDGLFASSELKPGQLVLYINDVPCPSTTKEAIALVKEAVGNLKIIAVPTDVTPKAAAKEADEAEEKKEEGAMDEQTDAVAPEPERGLIDKVFKACMC